MIATEPIVTPVTAVPTDQPHYPVMQRLLARDLKTAAEELGIGEVRYAVDLYYERQEARKSAKNQQRALVELDEPRALIKWIAQTDELFEDTIRTVLDYYTRSDPTGRSQWARSIVGIGPVLAAGLLAHLQIDRDRVDEHGNPNPSLTSVSKVWRFAGLDPTDIWEKGQKRPWNARLKVLCWLIGESFVKFSGHPAGFYGRVWRAEKDKIILRNERGDYAETAAMELTKKRYTKDTSALRAYTAGKLPDSQVHARAKRKAVKLFLSHYWEVSWYLLYGERPPNPWVIAHGGHTDYLPPPNAPWNP